MSKKKKGDQKKKGITIRGEFSNFKQFVLAGSIVAVAIGVIVAQAVKSVVDSLVTGILNPMIQLFLPQGDGEPLVITIKGVDFLVGDFLNTLVQMLITLAVIYVIARYIIKNNDVIGLEEDEKESSK